MEKHTGLFGLNRILFYPLLLISSIILFVIGIKFVKLMVGDCQGMECLAIGMFVIFLLFVLVGIIIVINIILIVMYENKNKENSNKKYLLTVYILVFLLLLFALFEGPSIVDNYQQKKLDTFLENHDIAMTEFAKNNDLNGCIKEVETTFYENYCTTNYDVCKNHCDISFGVYLSKFAIDRNDGTLCNDNPFCFSDFAKSTLNVDYCLKITEKYYKDNCLFTVANKKKELNICNYFDQNIDKQNCIYSVLESIFGDASTETFKTSATSSICSKIQDIVAKEDCVIKYSNNFNDCYNLTIGNNKDMCILKLSTRIKSDSNNLGNILDRDIHHCLDINFIGDYNIPYRDYCVLNLAKTIEECNWITYKYNLRDCYRSIAGQQNDANICVLMYTIPGFVESDIKNDVWNCMYAQSIIATTEDCEKYSNLFNTQDEKDDCFKTIAQKNEDLEICNKIVSSTIKEKCKSEINYFLNRRE